jgi:hypothetical protein
MDRWMLIALLYDQEGDVFETIEYRFPTYQECMDFRETMSILLSEDPEISSFKITVVNT